MNFIYDVNATESFECELEYAEVEGDGYNEPYYPEAVQPWSVKCHGVEILDYLSEQTINEIKIKALKKLKEDRKTDFIEP